MKEITAYISKKGNIHKTQSKAIVEDLEEEVENYCREIQRTYEGAPWIKQEVYKVFLSDDFDLKAFTRQIQQWRKLREAARALKIAEEAQAALKTPSPEEAEDIPF